MTPLTATGIDHLGDVLAFVRVADAQSFTLASERLGLSRSAIGKCIARLEQGLGARLLHRSTRSVSLSDEGRLFYEHAQRILAEVDNATGAMASRQEAPRGRLRIDLPVALGRLHIMPLLAGYLRQWPEVEADVSFSDDYADLERHGVPASPDALARHRTLAFTHMGAPVPWRYASHGQERSVAVAGRLRLGDTEALRDAALEGAGIVQLGAFLVGEDLRQGRLVPLLETHAPPGAPVCAVYPHRRHLAPKVRRLIDEIAARWAGGAPWGGFGSPPI